MVAAAGPADVAEPRADDQRAGPGGWLPPVALYLGVLAVLLVVSWQVASHVDPPVNRGERAFAGGWFWDGWLRWDGGWYRSIAEHGYFYVPGAQSSVAFFPGYPLTIRVVGRAIDNVPLAGMLTTIVCGLGVLVLFWRWCRARMSPGDALVALGLLALYPYAWYLYGAVYGDALFVLTALGAFTLLEHDRPVLAGIAGAAATFTRLVGVAVFVGLVLLVLERRGALVGRRRFGLPRRIELSRLRRGDAGVLLSLGGLATWSLWLWHRYGDPLLFSSVQAAWEQPASLRTWLKIDFGASLLHGSDRLYSGGLVVQATIALAVLAATPFVARRFGLGYGAYTFVLLVIPIIGSQDFQGLGRYCIGAFPAFALAAERLAAHRRAVPVVLAGCAVALVVGTALFADNRYLS